MKRIARQHLGGVANLSGHEFEEHWGIWRVIRALGELEQARPLRMALQLRGCRVDDWVEEDAEHREYFQLKNKKRLGWADVADDFRWQIAKRVRGRTSGVTLVVARHAQATSLRRAAEVPSANVVVFPGNLRPLRQLETSPVKEELQRVCVEHAPTSSDLESIWKSVDFAWRNARRPGRFVATTTVLDVLLDHEFPPLRVAWRPSRSWRVAEALLNQAGLTCRIESGHLFYDDGAGTSGRMSCRTAEFRDFIKRVRVRRPTTLTAVRELL